ncbi:MAG: MBL fold metallo-hydrolase [Gemmatimonadales bacterium]|jgi:glyoxylase-like metal-dependent hydrolase (beta-lactamase superfamily II)
MSRVTSRQLGRFRLHALDAGVQRLDGGAMFGVVPKPLWEKKLPPDERNRIPLAMRPLLVETDDELVLIDSGAGNKEDAKFRDIYGIENGGQPTALEDAVREAGFKTSDVSVVINTHLHFDHAGGDTVRLEDGSVVPSFPGVRHVVQTEEWKFAHTQNERVRASYLLHNFDPVHEAGLLDLVAGNVEIVPGITVWPTPGHTPGHQSVLIESQGESALFVADLVPTAAHLPLPWIMGYDVEPLVTLETKRRVLEGAARERTLLVFEHDPETTWGYLTPREKRPTLVDSRPD